MDFLTHWLIVAGVGFFLLFWGLVIELVAIRSERKRSRPR